MKNLPLYWKIIIGMILGVLYGLIANSFGWVEFVDLWVKPFGVIFVNLLKLIAVPLVFASLVKGISSLSDISKLSRIGSRTILFYICSTVISVSLGLVLVNSINPGNSFSEEKKIELKEKYASKANLKINAANKVKGEGPLQFLVDIVPSNIVDASSKNQNMLQVIFFAILFAISLIMMPNKNTMIVKGFFDGLNDIILKDVRVLLLTLNYPQHQRVGPPYAVSKLEVDSLYGGSFQCQELQNISDIENEPMFLLQGVDFVEKAVYCLQKVRM